jgi:hypothetical protein
MMEKRSAAKPLRLLAHDLEDLQVISAALQDAIAHVGDIRYEPGARRLTVLFNRYRWEACPNGDCERVVAALQFGDVVRLQHKGLRSDDKGALVADGLELRLEVDCIDAVLADVSDPWPASREPVHLASDDEVPEDAVQGEDA